MYRKEDHDIIFPIFVSKMSLPMKMLAFPIKHCALKKKNIK